MGGTSSGESTWSAELDSRCRQEALRRCAADGAPERAAFPAERAVLDGEPPRRHELDPYEALLEATSDLVLVSDRATHRFLRGNSRARRLLGNDMNAWERGLAALAPHHGADMTAYLEELSRTGAAQRLGWCLRRPDGSLFDADLQSRVHHGGTEGCYVTAITDRSVLTRRERELWRAQRELETAHLRMLHNNKLVALGQIAAGVAHELNNPASYVLMNLDELTEILERAQQAHKTLRTNLLAWLEGEQRERAEECLSGFPLHRTFQVGGELVAECVDGLTRITSLVKDLRGFARIDEIDVSPVSLNDVVITACKMIGTHLRQRARLETSLSSERTLLADRRRLVQVVTNLLMNAAQAVESGEADLQCIEVTTRDDEDDVVLRVRDTGPGIPPDLADAIFEPFFTTKRKRGTGLGLSLCAEIVRQHAGRVSVVSTPGGGATFEVRLPFDTGLRPAANTDPEPRVAGTGRARVLVIDDEPHLVRAYERALSRHHDVTVAYGGAAGLALIEKNSAFDAILCDLSMPDVDGVRIYRSLERIAPELKARVIFSSGGALTRRAEELLSSVNNPLLEKPVVGPKLLAAIEQVRARSAAAPT